MPDRVGYKDQGNLRTVRIRGLFFGSIKLGTAKFIMRGTERTFL